MEDNSKELNGFLTAMNKKRNDLFFTILVPKKSHFTRRLDQFKNVEYVKDIENRFEEPGKEISSMPYINKYIYDKLDTLQKDHHSGLSHKDKRVMNLMENMRESFFMSERWAATYNPANFRSVQANNDKPRLFWRDWDVDLVLSFHPAIMHKHINHFKKNTDMDPQYISRISFIFLGILNFKSTFIAFSHVRTSPIIKFVKRIKLPCKYRESSCSRRALYDVRFI